MRNECTNDINEIVRTGLLKTLKKLHKKEELGFSYKNILS